MKLWHNFESFPSNANFYNYNNYIISKNLRVGIISISQAANKITIYSQNLISLQVSQHILDHMHHVKAVLNDLVKQMHRMVVK